MPRPLTRSWRSWRSWPLALPRFAVAGLFSLTAAALSGCAVGIPVEETSQVGEAADEVSDVVQSVVKRQSIGNCWLYATASWLESMNLAATGTELNASESYWTYWHWFEQIANGEVHGDELSTGGGWGVSSYLIKRYGVIPEADFIPEEANAEISYRQDQALDTINASLKSGALATASARANRKLVRAELDAAFGLRQEMIDDLDKVFGVTVARNLTTRSVSTGRETASTSGTAIKRPRKVQVSYSTGPGLAMEQKNLEQAIQGWHKEGYWGSRRDFQKRLQRALHDAQPVIISWFVDFNALDSQGRFFEPPATPGHQGGHMTVLEDYEVDQVPGFGTLPAGVTETRADALEAALSDEAELKFLRVKNSWGSFRADRQFAVPGYHDLYLKYLDGPVKSCSENDDGSPDPSSCWDTTPLRDAVLPPGY